MDALAAILTRRTVPPVKMTGPGPDTDALGRILDAAMAAPDHGKLRPWRFIVIEAAAREAYGAMVARALAADDPQIAPGELEKARTNPLKAASLVIVACTPDRANAKIPEIEQIGATAAACQNMLLAAHAMGFAAKWATGRPAASPSVKRGLGLHTDDHIIGILYLGSYGAAHETPERAPAETCTVRWQPVS